MYVPKVAAGSALGAVLALTLALAGCGSSRAPDRAGASKASPTGVAASKVINVVASTDVYADIARSVGGEA